MLFFELFPAFMAIVSMGVFILLVVLDQQGRREALAERESPTNDSQTARAVSRRRA